MSELAEKLLKNNRIRPCDQDGGEIIETIAAIVETEVGLALIALLGGVCCYREIQGKLPLLSLHETRC